MALLHHVILLGFCPYLCWRVEMKFCLFEAVTTISCHTKQFCYWGKFFFQLFFKRKDYFHSKPRKRLPQKGHRDCDSGTPKVLKFFCLSVAAKWLTSPLQHCSCCFLGNGKGWKALFWKSRHDGHKINKIPTYLSINPENWLLWGRFLSLSGLDHYQVILISFLTYATTAMEGPGFCRVSGDWRGCIWLLVQTCKLRWVPF